jgi:hypothetical protein
MTLCGSRISDCLLFSEEEDHTQNKNTEPYSWPRDETPKESLSPQDSVGEKSCSCVIPARTQFLSPAFPEKVQSSRNFTGSVELPELQVRLPEDVKASENS